MLSHQEGRKVSQVGLGLGKLVLVDDHGVGVLGVVALDAEIVTVHVVTVRQVTATHVWHVFNGPVGTITSRFLNLENLSAFHRHHTLSFRTNKWKEP